MLQAKLLRQAIATTAFEEPKKRVYDPQLDHWGIKGLPGEDYYTMFRRLTDGEERPLSRWFESNDNGIKDNGIEGVAILNQYDPSKNIYYFTCSFAATVSERELDITGKDVDAIQRAGLVAIRENQKLLQPTAAFPFIWDTIDFGISLFRRAISLATSYFRKSNEDIVAEQVNLWRPYLIPAIIDRVFARTGRLPIGVPGTQIPHPTMFPVFFLFAYTMGSYELSIEQFRSLRGVGPLTSISKEEMNQLRIESIKFHKSDGVVNTESMKGPSWSRLEDVNAATFNLQAIERGVFYHLGAEEAMDHAAVIGITLDEDMVYPPGGIRNGACVGL